MDEEAEGEEGREKGEGNEERRRIREEGETKEERGRRRRWGKGKASEKWNEEEKKGTGKREMEK